MSSSGILRQAASSLLHSRTGATQKVPKNTKHIAINGLLRSTTPEDVRRAVLRASIGGITDVAIDYEGFRPTGRAIITLNHPDSMDNTLRALKKLTIGGVPTKSEAIVVAENVPTRGRGLKGRSQAVERGALNGNGPHGGILNGDKNVVIWGFPGTSTVEGIKSLLAHYDVAKGQDGKLDIVKVNLPQGKFSMVSRFLIRMTSTSEAHRLVRDLHMTYFDEKTFNSRFPLQASIVY